MDHSTVVECAIPQDTQGSAMQDKQWRKDILLSFMIRLITITLRVDPQDITNNESIKVK